MLIRSALTVAIVLSSLLGATVRAQEAGPSVIEAAEIRARAHFEAGTVFFEAGEIDSALREFTAAYDISRRPELLWNIALCAHQLGHLEEAAEALERFGAAGAPGHSVEAVEERLAEIHRQIEERGPLPGEEPVVAPAPPIDTTPYLAIAGFTVAAVGVVAFAIFGPLTLVEDATLADECSPTCSRERAAMLDVYAVSSDVSLGVALLGAVLGVVGLVTAPSAPATSEGTIEARLVPYLGPGAAGLGLGGSF